MRSPLRDSLACMPSTMALGGTLLVCSLFGCAVPPPGQPPKRQTASDEEQVRSLLARFEAGVQKDDIPGVMSLYSPTLFDEKRSKEQKRIEGAVKTYRYSEYRLFHQPSELRLPWQSLRDGQVKVEVRFSKPGGKIADDFFTFRREKGRWYLTKAELKRPDEGEDVDLGSTERDQIVSVVSSCNRAILSGDMDVLLASVSKSMPPAERAKVRKDLGDLMKFHKYQYFSSSFSRSGLEIEFGSKGSVVVPLDFMYVRHDGRRGERKTGRG